MFHSIRLYVLAALFVAGALLVGAEALAKGHDTAHHTPRISVDQAQETALARIPGEVLDHELEREHGIWIYSFEIRPRGERGRIVKEVNVDADTGKIVSVETERR